MKNSILFVLSLFLVLSCDSSDDDYNEPGIIRNDYETVSYSTEINQKFSPTDYEIKFNAIVKNKTKEEVKGSILFITHNEKGEVITDSINEIILPAESEEPYTAVSTLHYSSYPLNIQLVYFKKHIK